MVNTTPIWFGKDFTFRNKVVKSFVEKILSNLALTNQLTPETCAKLVLFKEINYWKPEDLFLMAAPSDKFKKYYHEEEYLYRMIATRKAGELIGEAALLECQPRYRKLTVEMLPCVP